LGVVLPPNETAGIEKSGNTRDKANKKKQKTPTTPKNRVPKIKKRGNWGPRNVFWWRDTKKGTASGPKKN